MSLGIILLLAWLALQLVLVLAMIRWGFENDQWKDIEEPKYRMLIDHELQPWPGRKNSPEDEKEKKNSV